MKAKGSSNQSKKDKTRALIHMRIAMYMNYNASFLTNGRGQTDHQRRCRGRWTDLKTDFFPDLFKNVESRKHLNRRLMKRITLMSLSTEDFKYRVCKV